MISRWVGLHDALTPAETLWLLAAKVTEGDDKPTAKIANDAVQMAGKNFEFFIIFNSNSKSSIRFTDK